MFYFKLMSIQCSSAFSRKFVPHSRSDVDYYVEKRMNGKYNSVQKSRVLNDLYAKKDNFNVLKSKFQKVTIKSKKAERIEGQ